MSSNIRLKVACTLAVAVAGTVVSAAGATPDRSLPVRHQHSQQLNRFQNDTVADLGGFVTDTLGGNGKRAVAKAARSITSTYVTGRANTAE